MAPTKSKRRIYNIFGCLALLFWSSTAYLVSELNEVPIFQFLSITLSFGALATALVITLRREWRKILSQPKQAWLFGALAVFVNQVGYVAAIKSAPPEQAEVIYYLWPILNILLAAIFLRGGFSLSHLLGAFFGFAGVYLLVTDGSGLEKIRPEYMQGYLFAFASALCWSFYSVYSSRKHHIPSTVLGLCCGLAAIPCMIAHLSFESSMSLLPRHWFLLALVGFLVLGLALILWDTGVKGGDIRFLSILSFATPIVSVGILIAFGKAVVTPSLAIACVLVVSGCIVGMRANKPAERGFDLLSEGATSDYDRSLATTEI